MLSRYAVWKRAVEEWAKQDMSWTLTACGISMSLAVGRIPTELMSL